MEKTVTPLLDRSTGLKAQWQAISPTRKGTLPSRVAGMPDAPAFESLNWRALLPESDLPW